VRIQWLSRDPMASNVLATAVRHHGEQLGVKRAIELKTWPSTPDSEPPLLFDIRCGASVAYGLPCDTPHQGVMRRDGLLEGPLITSPRVANDPALFHPPPLDDLSARDGSCREAACHGRALLIKATLSPCPYVSAQMQKGSSRYAPTSKASPDQQCRDS
jgi:hypothetical protein